MRLGGPWRLIYVVLPTIREVYVYDVVEHKDRILYGRQYIRKLLRASRLRRNPLDARVEQLIAQQPSWSDARIAGAAGCSPTAVRRRRIAWGVPARHALPWEPWRC